MFVDNIPFFFIIPLYNRSVPIDRASLYHVYWLLHVHLLPLLENLISLLSSKVTCTEGLSISLIQIHAKKSIGQIVKI